MSGKLEEIIARHQAATKGPWQWRGFIKSHYLHLQSTIGWRNIVMGFRRWGMTDAQPVFNDSVHDGGGVMLPVKDYVKGDRIGEFDAINHPDATFIAHSWEDVGWLIGEVKRLRERLGEAAS